MDYLVSIIVPVYKAEVFIERCAHALFGQTFLNMEYVFVDDASPDNSINIIQRMALYYPHRAGSIHYVRHSRNRGVAAARNTGLFSAIGDFVIFFDSDDWMEKNTVESMYEEIIRTNADIVWTDFYKTYPDHEILSVQKIDSTALACVKALLCEQMHGGLWNKLVRRSLYEKYDVCFLPGLNIWEDLRVCIQLFSYAKNIVYLPRAFYHYVQYNKDSVCTAEVLTGLNDVVGNAESVFSFLAKNGICDKVRTEMNYLKLATKRNLLIRTHLHSFIRWKLIYPEANAYILTYRALPLRLRMLGWFVTNNWWLVVKCWIFLKKKKL